MVAGVATDTGAAGIGGGLAGSGSDRPREARAAAYRNDGRREHLPEASRRKYNVRGTLLVCHGAGLTVVMRFPTD